MTKSNNNIYRDLNKRGDYSYKSKRKKNKIKKKINSIKDSKRLSLHSEKPFVARKIINTLSLSNLNFVENFENSQKDLIVIYCDYF
jgi:hypothetical protein